MHDRSIEWITPVGELLMYRIARIACLLVAAICIIMAILQSAVMMYVPMVFFFERVYLAYRPISSGILVHSGRR